MRAETKESIVDHVAVFWHPSKFRPQDTLPRGTRTRRDPNGPSSALRLVYRRRYRCHEMLRIPGTRNRCGRSDRDNPEECHVMSVRSFRRDRPLDDTTSGAVLRFSAQPSFSSFFANVNIEALGKY